MINLRQQNHTSEPGQQWKAQRSIPTRASGSSPHNSARSTRFPTLHPSQKPTSVQREQAEVTTASEREVRRRVPRRDAEQRAGRGRGRRAWETEAMERGEQVANGSMGWRGVANWQHETQRARGFGARGGFKSEDEGMETRDREGAPESHTSSRPGRGAPVDQAAVAVWLPPASSLLNDPPGAPSGGPRIFSLGVHPKIFK